MDTIAIAGSTLLMKTAQTQQTISLSIMKQAADQQKEMAHLLAQNAKQLQQTAPNTSGSTFSTYA